ncbi:regulator of sigma E protease [Oscillibacter sp. PC13]|uniref:M50 family metallopeptidase n=1 Tax=Oscillibacter sp. PC13 TaxID=1855299 RepID=UPI0008E9EE59|nr:site-2 protease family protein [Oscillibacter sp. PC13]SFP54158.1 regulator of sigma E protease [Oscillibacter sp. PC13]
MTFVYILAAVLIFGVLVAVHELGHFITAKLCGVRVNEFSIGMGPAIWSRQRGETLYALRALPVGGYCAMEGEDEDSGDDRALVRQSFWKQLLIFAAGSFMNLLAGFLIILVLYSSASGFYTAEIVNFAPELQQRGTDGLQAGDELWSIDGERVYLYSDISLLLGLNRTGVFDLVVLRDGEKMSLENVSLPRQEYTSTDGVSKYTGVGLYFGNVEPATLGGRLKNTWLNTVDFIRVVRLSLQMLLSGEAGMKDLSGPVGIVSTITEVGTASESVGAAVENIAYFAAMLAVNLAVMNMLPIPALDGGKILFLTLDTVSMKLFRKRIPERYEAVVNTAGFVILMGFMLIVTFHDVFKLFQ